MTAKEVFELRKQGHVEDAYEAARQLYVTDKSPYASLAMFWTAVDVLRKRVNLGRIEEAQKICLALERLLPNVPDKEGWVADAFENCRQLLENLEGRKGTQALPSEHTQIGQWGEEVAAKYLYGKGYEIVERDWHSNHRDIDIIAQRGNLFVFVEVKTRSNRDFGDPLDAIDYEKRTNLRRAINHYVSYRKIDNYRFDIITVVGTLGTPSPEITHLEDVNIMEFETFHRRRSIY